MNLDEANDDNLAFIIHDLGKRLNIVNRSLLDPDDFRLDDYEEVRDIYEMVVKRSNLSSMDIEGILSELGELRKRK